MEQSYVIRNDRVIGKTVPNINYNYSTCPIGSIFAFSSERIPLGFFICDGASYKVAEYPDLYAVIGNTYGGDSTNFNVPNLIDKFIQGSNTSGTEKEAGLPNITGENGAIRISDTTSEPTGAFYRDKTATYANNIEGAGTTISFDASKSNAIYGASDTVQPPALTMVYIIKAFHTNEGIDTGVSDDVVEYVDRKINDSEIQTNSTWSSSKINEELEDVRGELDIIVEEANKNTTINDEATSLTTTWSSKKTSDELGKKSNTINISMVGLGFTKGAEVPLEDFMIAISEKMSNNYSTIYKVNWTDENSAYVVFGNKKVNINGGVLYCSQSNTITNTWTDLIILYTPNVSSPNLYKFTARKDGNTLSVYMFEYPYMADTTSSTTSTYSSAKIDEKIAKHSLPIAFDSGIINNSTVQVYKLANVGYIASGGADAYNLNLLLSSRGAEEIELIGGKNDSGWTIEAIRNNKSFNKITNIYQDGLDIYVRLDLRCNYFRVYHKSGVLSGDFAISLVDTIPESATELTIRPHPTYINDSVTDIGSTWSSNKIASEITSTYLIKDIAAGGENEKTFSFKVRKNYFTAYYAKRTFLLSANIYSLGFSKPVIGLVEIYRSTTDNYGGYAVNLQDTRYTDVTVTVNGDYLEVDVTFNSYESSGCMVSCSSLSNVPIA